jgi:hypothetical protein
MTFNIDLEDAESLMRVLQHGGMAPSTILTSFVFMGCTLSGSVGPAGAGVISLRKDFDKVSHVHISASTLLSSVSCVCPALDWT